MQQSLLKKLLIHYLIQNVEEIPIMENFKQTYLENIGFHICDNNFRIIFLNSVKKFFFKYRRTSSHNQLVSREFDPRDIESNVGAFLILQQHTKMDSNVRLGDMYRL